MALYRTITTAACRLLAATAAPMAGARPTPFIVPPYLQIGSQPGPASLRVLWHTREQSASWAVQWRASPAQPWQPGAAPGNHDPVEHGDLTRSPDALAYFMFRDQPLNGPPRQADEPLAGEGGPLVRRVDGTAAQRQRFGAAAGAAFPRMANDAFDWGGTHWLVLDSNDYVDWSHPALQAWVREDLAATKAPWRTVMFHHPGYQSSPRHFHEQQMRLLAHVFDAGKADLVINGHVHNYQRTHPLRCQPAVGVPATKLQVEYRCSADQAYDGKTRTRPDGVIHVVTGAGGANLYDQGLQFSKPPWQPYTAATWPTATR